MIHKSELREELGRSAELLRTLRDEIRVQAHLGSMEAQARWRELEPRVEAVLQQAIDDASEATRRAVDEATRALRELGRPLH